MRDMRSFRSVRALLVLSLCLSACLARPHQERRDREASLPSDADARGEAIVLVGFHDATHSGFSTSIEKALRDGAKAGGVVLATTSIFPRPGRNLSPVWTAGISRKVRARWLVTGQIVGFVSGEGDRVSLGSEIRVHEGLTGRLVWMDHAIDEFILQDPATMFRSIAARIWSRWQIRRLQVSFLPGALVSSPSPPW